MCSLVHWSHANKMADDAKCFLGLLNSLTKRIYYGNEEFSDEFLKNEIYPDTPEEEFRKLVTKCRGIIKVNYSCV